MAADLQALLGGYALEALAAGQPAAEWWRALPPPRRYAIASCYFILAPTPLAEGGLTLSFFIEELMERLLQGLSRRTRREEKVYPGRVRGKINWPSTFKVRFGRDFDPSRFVCRELRYEYDTPENQLLRFLTQRLLESFHLVPETLRRGEWLPAGSDQPRPLLANLTRLENRLNERLRHVHFREITLPTHVTPDHLLRAGTSRSEEYAAVAQLYQQYEAIVLRGEWGPVQALLRAGLVLPAGPEPLWAGVNAAVLRA